MRVKEIRNQGRGAALVTPTAVARDPHGEFWLNPEADVFEPDDPNLPDEAVVAVRWGSSFGEPNHYEVCLNHEKCPGPEHWARAPIPAGQEWIHATVREYTDPDGRRFEVP